MVRRASRWGQLAFGGGVLVASLSLAVGCKPSGPDAGAAPPSATASGSARHGAISRWPAGEVVSYDVVLRTLTDNGQSPVPLLLTLTGRLEVSFALAGDALRGTVVLRNPALLDHAKRPLREAAQLVEELRRPFGVELRGGELVAYYEPLDAAPQTVGYRRQLAAVLQLPPGGTAPTRTTEWDATGLAQIEYAPARGGAAVTWKKLAYEKIVLRLERHDDAMVADDLKPRVEAATGTTEVDGHGLVRLTRHERLTLPLGSGRAISTEVDLTFARVGQPGRAPADGASGALFEASRRVPVGTPVDPATAANWDAVMVGGRTFTQVVAKLDELAASPGLERVPAKEREDLFRALVGLFRLRAETVALAKEMIAADSKLADLMVDALGMASTGTSIEALGALAFDDGLPRPRRLRAATVFVRAPRPNAAALDLCEKMLTEPTFREHGLLGLGTFTRLLRSGGETELATRAAARLERELEATQGATTPRAVADRVLVLLAVANSGEPRFFDQVVPDQDARDAKVRHAAIQAIRLMDDPRVEPRLLGLSSRTDEGDLAAALQALGRREVDMEATVKRVVELAKGSPEAMVRREAVLALVKWRERWPVVEATIKDRHDNDADRRVREAAYVK